MKYFVITSFIILTSIFQKEYRMEGNYKIEYEKPYDFQNGRIFFDDSIYVKTSMEGGKVFGKVEYSKYYVILTNKNSTQRIDFLKSDVEKDTVEFGTKETDPKKSLTLSYLEVSINRGKLIKLK
jgi:hypothetical protein